MDSEGSLIGVGAGVSSSKTQTKAQCWRAGGVGAAWKRVRGRGPEQVLRNEKTEGRERGEGGAERVRDRGEKRCRQVEKETGRWRGAGIEEEEG